MNHVGHMLGLLVVLGSFAPGCAEPDPASDEDSVPDTDVPLEGPAFDGQIEGEPRTWLASEQGITFAAAGEASVHVCIYDVEHLYDSETDDGMPKFALELDVPSGQLVHSDRDEYPTWFLTWVAEECPDVLPDGQGVWIADVRPGESAVIGVRSEYSDALVAASDGEPTGFILNLSATDVTVCFERERSTGFRRAAYPISSLWDADVSGTRAEEFSNSWLVPGAELETCYTRNRWMEGEATSQLHSGLDASDDGSSDLHTLVLFDGK